ncbi:MAG TPA: hypothetical protein VMV81_12985 [Phycisphaerae bacterium]|nr:hypothetical protein [Phycisphaerae bacterium]
MRVLLILTTIAGLTADVRAGVELWASGYNSNQVHRYDAATGAFLGTFGPGGDLHGTQAITLGPDGLLYVCSEEAQKVLRYDRHTLAYIDEFIFNDPSTPQDETGGLNGPTAALFGPDGNLYVLSFNSNSVIRYNGVTGAYIDTFIPTGSGALNGPDAGSVFGPDGNLYIASYFGRRILRYNGTTGLFIDIFINSGSGQASLANPRCVLFRSCCSDVLVNSEGLNKVLRYDATTGTFLNRIVPSVSTPTGIAIGPDRNLYVSSINDNTVHKYDGQTGAALGLFVPTGSGGLNGVVQIRFFPLIGDLNCDDKVNLLDVPPFVEALLDSAGYALAHPGCDATNADANLDGSIDGNDIAAFVKMLLPF